MKLLPIAIAAVLAASPAIASVIHDGDGYQIVGRNYGPAMQSVRYIVRLDDGVSPDDPRILKDMKRWEWTCYNHRYPKAELFGTPTVMGDTVEYMFVCH